MEAILGNLPTQGWNAKCIADLLLQEDQNFTKDLIHLVDVNGQPHHRSLMIRGESRSPTVISTAI